MMSKFKSVGRVNVFLQEKLSIDRFNYYSSIVYWIILLYAFIITGLGSWVVSCI